MEDWLNQLALAARESGLVLAKRHGEDWWFLLKDGAVFDLGPTPVGLRELTKFLDNAQKYGVDFETYRG